MPLSEFQQRELKAIRDDHSARRTIFQHQVDDLVEIVNIYEDDLRSAWLAYGEMKDDVEKATYHAEYLSKDLCGYKTQVEALQWACNTYYEDVISLEERFSKLAQTVEILLEEWDSEDNDGMTKSIAELRGLIFGDETEEDNA